MSSTQQITNLKKENDVLKKENKKLTNSKKYAWAKYYSEVNERLDNDTTKYIKMNYYIEYIPEHIKSEYISMLEELKKDIECPICYEIIDKKDLKISNCGHKYCNECFDRLITTKNECALCKKKLKY